MISNEKVNLWALITNVMLLFTGAVQYVRELTASAYTSPSDSPIAPGSERLYTLIFVGLLSAIVGGILWTVIERIAAWNIGAGGTNDGWSAIAASLSLTVPLVVVPVLYQRFAHIQIVLARHVVAGCVAVLLNALGWILMYGWRSIGLRGWKNIIEAKPASANLYKRLSVELVFTVVNFCTVVLVYRVIVDSQFGPLGLSLLEKVLVPAVVYFSGMAVFTLARYPHSIIDTKWIEIRGVIAGTLLVLTLTGGMLM